jgi:hypothetical protein
VMAAAHKDARHAEWLLEKSFPAEYGDRRPLPIPQEAQTMVVTFPATLPSGHTADAAEIMAVARQFNEAAQPREQHENEPKPKNDDEPMKNWYNPVTRRVEPIDNGEHKRSIGATRFPQSDGDR